MWAGEVPSCNWFLVGVTDKTEGTGGSSSDCRPQINQTFISGSNYKVGWIILIVSTHNNEMMHF